MKYKKLLEEWLTEDIRPSVKEKTYLRYRDIVRLHLAPALGEKEPAQLTPSVLQKFITTLAEHGNRRTGGALSAGSVNSVITVLQSTLKTALRLGYITEYTADKIKRPKKKEKTVECFTVAEQKKIEAAVLSDRRPKMFGVLLCLYTGLRIGELLALEWRDVDFRKSELSVNKSCHDSQKGGVFCRVTEAPKTPSSRRIVPIPKQLLPLLREHFGKQKKKASPALVIDGKDVHSVRSYQYSFSLLLRRLGIPHRGFHALRHTFATRALECGMDVKTLSEILGHKNPTVTLERYVHSLMPHKHEAMNKLGKLL